MAGVVITFEERLVNDFAYRSFRDIADGDYIAARTAYFARLVPQFLWSSQQAIEKYLKCALLLNRVPARKVKHDLVAALKLLAGQKRFELKLSDVSLQFIDYIDTYGRHRYFESSYYIRGPAVVHLDYCISEVRRYAQSIDYEIEDDAGARFSVLPDRIAAIRRAEKDKSWLQLDGGLLEKLLGDGTHPARAALLRQNLFFSSRKRKNVNVAAQLSASNAPLLLHPVILDTVEKYVLIPKSVAAAYRELLKTQSAT